MFKKFNRSPMMRMASVMLVLSLALSCAVGGTMAKYISTTTGSDTATVAKWSFTVNDTEFATATDAGLTFDLFDTINDTGNAADEADVADLLIAPGTAGSFAMEITNASEVNAKYTVELAEENEQNVPLQYSIDNTNWVDSIEELAMTSVTDNDIAMEATETVTVYWRWVYDNEVENAGGHNGQTNTTDTALGIAARDGAVEVKISATLTAYQVD